MSQAAIIVRDLEVIRGGRPVLHRISLTVDAGKITGLLGPSGCGKTTLMRSIVGVQVIEAGEVAVLGLPAGSPPLRRRVAYQTQRPSVYGDLTVRENLRYFARVLGVPQRRVDEMIRTVGLEDDRASLVSRLSGGQVARVSLATALLGEPEVLVLDEPTVGLDPVLRLELWREFARLAEGGAALLVSSHVMEEAERCDDLVLMREGRLLANEPRESLLRRTNAPDVERAFLAVVGVSEA